MKTQLSKLLTAIITHGYQPRDILLGTITSIPKDRAGSPCNGKNYRGITLCTSIAKLIDIVMIMRYNELLNTSDMQFAFKKNHSTVMCSTVLKETINYYLNNGSEVYTCFIDATKAFDRVRHDKLFQLLIDRNIPALALRAMLDLYQRQLLRTVWKGCVSQSFTSSNGIRQGGIISPLLFCIYMDELLKRLETEGVGCWIGKHYLGSLGYADDLTVASPSGGGLKQMVATCEKFGDEYSVEYNPTKTLCCVFSRKRVRVKPEVCLAGVPLVWVESVKHLGNQLDSDLSEKTEIRNKKGDLINRVNKVIATLENSSDNIKIKLFNSQCAHFYGAQAWNLTDKAVDSFQITWNRSVRRLLNLPHATHTRFLPHLIDTPNALDQISCRFIKMMQSMMKSDNLRVRFLANMCRTSARSIIGRNLMYIANRLKIDVREVLRDGRRLLKQAYIAECTQQDKCDLSLICDLRQSLNGTFIIEGFNKDDMEYILNEVCEN